MRPSYLYNGYSYALICLWSKTESLYHTMQKYNKTNSKMTPDQTVKEINVINHDNHDWLDKTDFIIIWYL